MTGKPRIVLYGAGGHTGRFVAAEIARRGWTPLLAGRDMAKLKPVAVRHGAEARQVEVVNATGLDRLLAGADAVINCAGPFGDTAPPLIEAALRAGIAYLDVTAEPLVTMEVFASYADAAREAGVVVAPAFGFFGALGDLLATAAMGDWHSAERIDLALALDEWKPTRGSRLAGVRRAGRRVVFADRRLEIHDGTQAAPEGEWTFPAPFGEQPVLGEFSTVDVVTIARHLDVDAISTWINLAPLADLRDPATPEPDAGDASGRSAQQFIFEAVVRRGGEQRHAWAAGRDIYWVTAPLVVEAAGRILDGRARTSGMAPAGELFDAGDFLSAMAPRFISKIG